MTNKLEVPYRYRARLKRVVDGDTFDLVVDLGHRTQIITRYRLRGVDTPEIRGEEREEGVAAAEFAHNWFFPVLAALGDASPWPLVIDTHKDETGRYGRWIADIYEASTGESLADALVSNGHAEVINP